MLPLSWLPLAPRCCPKFVAPVVHQRHRRQRQPRSLQRHPRPDQPRHRQAPHSPSPRLPLQATQQPWDIGDDGKSITFHLQPNVKFHDGTACDAAAVKWNLDRIVDPSANSPLRGQLQPPLQQVDVVDATTVKLTSSTAWRPLLCGAWRAARVHCVAYGGPERRRQFWSDAPSGAVPSNSSSGRPTARSSSG
ncbi:MAG: hypothetical protein JO352_18825 [Chloroflexi bacterium]|nr:hypothetical protein [Chloroflexota bacterium]